MLLGVYLINTVSVNGDRANLGVSGTLLQGRGYEGSKVSQCFPFQDVAGCILMFYYMCGPIGWDFLDNYTSVRLSS